MNITSEKYHRLTSYQRHHIPAHSLDWENKPSPYKLYSSQNRIVLPADAECPHKSMHTLLNRFTEYNTQKTPDISELAGILRVACGITAKTRYNNGDFFYRSVASAGALYPCEVYVLINNVKGLDQGLYHYSVVDHALSFLRQGYLKGYVEQVCGINLHGLGASIVFFLSAIFFRSAWKYRERSYRYHLLDTGHLLENLELAVKAHGFSFKFSYDFDDEKTNRLLGVNERKEVCLAVGWISDESLVNVETERPKLPELIPDMKAFSKVSALEKDYPLVLEMHRSGNFSDFEIQDASHGSFHPISKSVHKSDSAYFAKWPEIMNCEETFLRRRSRRNFVAAQVSKECFSAFIHGLKCDDHRNLYVGLILANVEDRISGQYLINRETAALELINEGNFTEDMSHICLDQRWMAHAGIHIFFVADLEQADSQDTARRYRHIMMQAGKMGERIYLQSTSMGLGCCGIGAFYDDEAASFLNLSTGERMLYLVAVGPVKSF